MARLPNIGGDKGNWGSILNDFLQEAHGSDGSLKPISQSGIQGLDSSLAAKADQTALDAEVSARTAQGPSGRELAYAESSIVQTGITTPTDITNLTVSFTVGARPVIIEVLLPFVYCSAIPAIVTATITDLSNTIISAGSVVPPAANSGIQIAVRERISTPGSYSRKVRLQRLTGSGAVSLNFDSTTIASISAIER